MTHKYNDKEEESFMACEPSSWGGQWTEEKLDAFEKYVNAYLTIMNSFREKNKWKLIYFDGFAGSGSRNEAKKEVNSELLQELFRDYCLDETELETYKGAAERVLGIPQRDLTSITLWIKTKNRAIRKRQDVSL